MHPLHIKKGVFMNTKNFTKDISGSDNCYEKTLREVIYINQATEESFLKTRMPSESGVVFEGCYVDDLTSEVLAEKRPCFMRMIQDAKAGKFDRIVVCDFVSFSRRISEVVKYTEELKKHGIGVYFVKENYNTLDETGSFVVDMMKYLMNPEIENSFCEVIL